MKNAKTLKYLLTLACLLAALCAFTLAAHAEIIDSGTCGAEGDGSNLTWTLDDAGTLIISGKGEMKEYLLKYDNYYYSTAPWGSSISNAKRVKTVIIKNGITNIGKYAFFQCTELTKVTIPDNVTNIGNGVFYKCMELTEITIPDGVTSIGERTFSDCTGLMSVTIPDSVTSIGNYAFKDCVGLTSVMIPDSVTSIGEEAFRGCTRLTSVTIPDNVMTIGMYAFYNTQWFDNQPKGLVYAGKVAYKYKGFMPNNTEIVIKNDTKSISSSAFEYCKDLTKVIIPDSVKCIGDLAFRGCIALTSVTIPNSVTSIGRDAFRDTAWFNNQPDGLVYAGKVAYTYKGVMPKNTNITLKEGTKEITAYAFYECTGLTSATIPDSVTRIGVSAFSKCTNLTFVTIPDSETAIGDFAFFGCTGLTSVTIPDSVASIGYAAFSGCTGLKRFYYTGTEKKWKKIDSQSGIQPSFYDCLLQDGIVYNNSKTTIQTVYDNTITNVVIPDSVTSIGRSAFFSCTGLASVTIPDSVTNIASNTFSGCTGLTQMTIPDSVTDIGNAAFSGCTSLKEIQISENVAHIGSNAFTNTAWYAAQPDGVVYLNKYVLGYTGELPREKALAIKEGTIGIADEAFSGLTWLKEITIPASIQFMGSNAFANCANLQQVNINDTDAWCGIVFGDKNANPTAYSHSLTINNEKLTRLSVSDQVKNIGSYAFYHCSPLTSLNLPVTIESIGTDAFTGCTEITDFSVGRIVESYDFSAMPKLQTLTLLPGTESVKEAAYKNLKYLNAIYLPISLKQINSSAFENCDQLNDVFYEGSEAQWKNVAVEKGNLAISQYATIHYNSQPPAILPGEMKPGDVDGDGDITSADARLALRASVGLEKDIVKGSAAYAAADADGDGEVTSGDARLILRASVGLEDASKFGKKA